MRQKIWNLTKIEMPQIVGVIAEDACDGAMSLTDTGV